MHERLEILGFLSRWGLIATSVAGIIAAAAACLANAGADSQQASLVMCDAVWNGSGKFYVDGRMSPPAGRKSMPLLMGGGYGQPWEFAVAEQSQVWQHVSEAPPGVSTIAVRGVPYSSMETIEASCRLLVVPPGRKLFLLDVRLATQDIEQTRKLMPALQTIGEAAMFSGSPPETMNQQRSSLRASDLYSVLVGQARAQDDWLGTLREAAKSAGRARREVEVITADPVLAVQASNDGFTVDLVTPLRVAPASAPSLHVFESLTKLQAQLADRPIIP